MADLRATVDRQGDVPLDQALGDLLADGTMRRHARKARRVYQARRDHAATLIAACLSDFVDFSLPSGGLAIWLRLRTGASAAGWAESAARLGLSLIPGAQFALEPDSAPEAFRIGFAALDEAEFSAACDLMARSRPGAAA